MMFELLFVLVIVFLVILIFLYRKALIRLKELTFAKQSLSAKYGKMTEQFIPFMERYPYDESKFRFIGSPIDGIQFEDDKIVFMEFKTAGSMLSEKQKQIRDLIRKKKVEFEEFRVK